MRFVGESGKFWKSRPESLTNFMKLSPEKIVVVEFSQTELLNVDRFSWKNIYFIFSSLTPVSTILKNSQESKGFHKDEPLWKSWINFERLQGYDS